MGMGPVMIPDGGQREAQQNKAEELSQHGAGARERQEAESGGQKGAKKEHGGVA
jgi:hypothetical protein